MATIERIGKKWRYRVRLKEKGIIVYEDSKSGFTTKKEAEIYAKKSELAFRDGLISESTNDLFVEYYKKWVELYKIDNTPSRTNDFRRGSINKANKLFKSVKIKDISKDMYQKIINDLSLQLSKATIKKYHNYFKACLEHALDNNIINNNPAKNAIIKDNTLNTKRPEDRFLNLKDTKKLYDALLNLEYTTDKLGRNCAIIALETGMRFGEILGLTWDKVNLKKQTITIDRTWDYHNHSGFLPTKTKNIRHITMSTFLVNFLKQIKRDFPNNEFIISNAHEQHISNNGANKSLKSACNRAGIKVVTMHALRHTHGSILFYKGHSILYISKRLGHASVSMTQEVYLHIIQELQHEEDNRIKKEGII